MNSSRIEIAIDGIDDAALMAEVESAIRDSLLTDATTVHVSPCALALAHYGSGDVDAALTAFDEAAEQRSPWLSYLKTEPRLESLREMPAVQKILSAIYETA